MYNTSKALDVLVYGAYWAVLLYWFYRRMRNSPVVRQRVLVRESERGQGLVEYALILTLVAVVVIAVLMVLGPSIKQLF
jgi:pilus assembly protein Flp/PilA